MEGYGICFMGWSRDYKGGWDRKKLGGWGGNRGDSHYIVTL